MLDPPAVPPSVYDTSYYSDCCMGSAEWSASDGRDTHGAYPFYLDWAGVSPGEVLVDIGAGRGELVALAAARGASRAIGVEYSPDAVRLAQRTLAAHGNPQNAEVVLADARSLPLPDASADLATMFDVVEHLTPAELAAALSEVRRVLRPGGRVAVHTMPNRLYYDFAWRALRLLRPHWPADPRNELERAMHVNEQTRRTLRRSLVDAGLANVRVSYGKWTHDGIIPAPRARRAIRWFARHRATAWFAAGDLWAKAYRP